MVIISWRKRSQKIAIASGVVAKVIADVVTTASDDLRARDLGCGAESLVVVLRKARPLGPRQEPLVVARGRERLATRGVIE
jgi:hypothetical protein